MDRTQKSLPVEEPFVLSAARQPIGISEDGRISVRIARHRAQLREAFQLLQRKYCEAGLSRATQSLRVLPYHLWRETQIFVAQHRGRVIGSISLTRDGNEGGIPMESTYRDQVRQLRDTGRPFGEVSSLTVESPEDQSTGEVFGQLTRLMMFHARYVGLEYILAVVHPRHARFYERAMGFQAIGGLSRYQQVGGQPGIAILGHVNDRTRYRSRWQRFYFDGDFSDADLAPNSLSEAERSYFAQFLPQTADTGRKAA
ncbi:hypothetical protein FYK55_05035 [Roseiconus nitratireducens]|uniref:N-acyl amino acid synthase FeeM catalytic core domain-containing protein n=1 Tax=Roseiconus nitratireducens TaxID=2605748 RepID=A0A5M6DFS4_9BACT|nr:hypothetical protein [Roseiconus nitratireducens]KAA5546253.1 hypothetical protein FYK55_05035 [Roseiconus nitratireducens]